MMTMMKTVDHQHMIKEYNNLDRTIQSLYDFLDSEEYKKLDIRSRELLLAQKDYMELYLSALGKRIDLLGLSFP